MFHLLAFRLECRIWGEHVDSASNVADEPSRELGRSVAACRLEGNLFEAAVPKLTFADATPLEELVALFSAG